VGEDILLSERDGIGWWGRGDVVVGLSDRASCI
jgi:hypothetical protein